MTVEELIEELNLIEDKDLNIRVLENNPESPNFNTVNYWLSNIEVHSTGQSGYEQNGEITLIGEE